MDSKLKCKLPAWFRVKNCWNNKSNKRTKNAVATVHETTLQNSDMDSNLLQHTHPNIGVSARRRRANNAYPNRTYLGVRRDSRRATNNHHHGLRYWGLRVIQEKCACETLTGCGNPRQCYCHCHR